MVTPRLKDLLEEQHVAYQTIAHPIAYDAQHTAEAANISGHAFAKTVLVMVDGRLCMLVLPASDYVNLDALRLALGAKELRLAHEYEFQAVFPDCEIGAMPPFGDLYGIEVFVSPHLRENEDIVFNAGSHDEAIRMHYRDYERLARPTPLYM